MFITLICKQCSAPYQRKPSRVQESSFCSRRCRSNSLRDRFQAQRIPLVCQYCQRQYGKRPSQAAKSKHCSLICRQLAEEVPGAFPSEKIALICPFCGSLFARHPSRLKHGRGKYCSPKCQYAAKRAQPHKFAQCICLNCGKMFERYHGSLKQKKGAGKYCSRDCRDRHRIQKNHPMYINGHGSEFRGANWQSQKRKARKRDAYTCQHCFLTEADSLSQKGVSLQVHHVVPYRLFTSYKLANRLANLLTLCDACHRKADAAIHRRERKNQQLSLLL
jgi:5-methylcytosine-specific restriction endonuclease McrA